MSLTGRLRHERNPQLTRLARTLRTADQPLWDWVAPIAVAAVAAACVRALMAVIP